MLAAARHRRMRQELMAACISSVTSFGIAFALRLLHHLADQELELAILAGANLRDDVRVRADDALARSARGSTYRKSAPGLRRRRCPSAARPESYIFANTSLATVELIVPFSTIAISPASAAGVIGTALDRRWRAPSWCAAPRPSPSCWPPSDCPTAARWPRSNPPRRASASAAPRRRPAARTAR